MTEKKAHQHMIEALRALAKKRCNKKNCGTVCLCGSCHARKALEHFDTPPSAKPKIHIIESLPAGWWYQDDRNDCWNGPFPNAEEAFKMAESLAPERSTSIRLIEVQVFEKRIVRIPRYKECPHCEGGFKYGSCCRYCDGSNRLEIK